VKAVGDSNEGESPGGSKAQESHVPRGGLNHRYGEADFRVEQSPEGEGCPDGLAKNGGRSVLARGGGRERRVNKGSATTGGQRRRTTANGYAEGKSSEGMNPKSGSGMKQGRQAMGRMKASRGRENPRAQAVERWNARPLQAAAPMRGNAVGEETSREDVETDAAERSGEDVTAARFPESSEGEHKLGRGF